MDTAAGPVVVLRERDIGEIVARVARSGVPLSCLAVQHDEGDVWEITGHSGETAFISPADQETKLPPNARLLLTVNSNPHEGVPSVRSSDSAEFGVECCLLDSPLSGPLRIYVVPQVAAVFDRVRGIFETDILRERSVCIFGVGSGGSFIARELAKCGVGSFSLVDSDRLEVGNVSRHECGLKDVGRLKVHCVRDLILQHHPSANVSVATVHVSGKTRDQVRELVQASDLVICATDNRESRLIINRISVQEEKPVIFGGVFLRAVGGQVLRVIPKITPCYQCFVTALPEESTSNEISSADDANRLTYTDRPMPIEPGLSSDLLPIALHIVKLALVELLRDSATSLSSLRQDLAVPWYLWVNRRDPNTKYSEWEPLLDNIDGMRILRWYGIALQAVPNCPVCQGAFEGSDIDAKFFESSS